MKISIIGQGYVGLTVGLFASKNSEVVGYDLNKKLIKQLNSGISHVEGLPSLLLQKALDSGKYRATDDPKEINGFLNAIGITNFSSANPNPFHSPSAIIAMLAPLYNQYGGAFSFSSNELFKSM